MPHAVSLVTNNSFLYKKETKVSFLIAAIVITAIALGILMGKGINFPKAGIVYGTLGGAASVSFILFIISSVLQKQRSPATTPGVISKGHSVSGNKNAKDELIAFLQGLNHSHSHSHHQGTHVENSLALQSMDVSCSQQEYRKWLFSAPRLSDNNRKMLEATLSTEPPQQGEIVEFAQIAGDNQQFNDLLQRTFDPSIIEVNRQWFDYNEAGHYYVDCANHFYFGGGYRTSGSVQEEIMFLSMPKLSHLHHALEARGLTLKCTNSTSRHDAPPTVEPTPFIVKDVNRRFNLDRHYAFRRQLLNDTAEQIHDGTIINPPSPPVHVIGIAAINCNHHTGPYTNRDLLYHLKAAFFAFDGAKRMNAPSLRPTIHTTDWGCGAFANSKKVMWRIQALAARMAGVTLVFHTQSDRDREEILQINEGLVGKTPQQVIEEILTLSQSDSSLCPQRR